MRFSKEIVRFSKQISLKELSRLIFFILKDFWFASIVIGLVVADSQLSLHKNQTDLEFLPLFWFTFGFSNTTVQALMESCASWRK